MRARLGRRLEYCPSEISPHHVRSLHVYVERPATGLSTSASFFETQGP